MSPVDAHVNFGASIVTVKPNPPSTGTSLTVANGNVWPATPFNATVWPTGQIPAVSNAEIVRVTSNSSGVLTIIRGQEGSSSYAIDNGDSIAATFTAKFVDDLTNASNLVSGILPDARIPSPDLKVTGTNPTRILITSTIGAANARSFGITNVAGTNLYLVPYPDDFSAGGAGLRLDRNGNAFIGADFYEKGRGTPMGHWLSIGYNAANFTNPAGSWTVDSADQVSYWYMLLGRTLWLTFTLQNTTVSVATQELRISLPSGLTNAFVAHNPFMYVDGSVAGTGVALSSTGESFVRLRKDLNAVGTWPVATNTCQVAGTLAIPIN